LQGQGHASRRTAGWSRWSARALPTPVAHAQQGHARGTAGTAAPRTRAGARWVWGQACGQAHTHEVLRTAGCTDCARNEHTAGCRPPHAFGYLHGACQGIPSAQPHTPPAPPPSNHTGRLPPTGVVGRERGEGREGGGWEGRHPGTPRTTCGARGLQSEPPHDACATSPPPLEGTRRARARARTHTVRPSPRVGEGGKHGECTAQRGRRPS
jgi:hypothetical protein